MTTETPQSVPNKQPPPLKEPGSPVASLVLGILGLFAWILPIVGLPISITGLALGVNALKRVRKGMAVAGIVLCSMGFLLGALNFAWGAYLGATGQHLVVNKILGK
jgi:hypothetical protein